MSRQKDALVGRTVAGKFAIEEHIGSGAMGKVYRARQIALEKTVAVKVLHQDLARDETFAARFHREAKAASRLDHPNSVRIIDFGSEPDGMLYIAMEFLGGRDLLRVIVDDGPMPEARAVDILMQALAALVVAHDMGVVHRDLKPENIMILESSDDEGHRVDLVKVCDFGIAKISGRSLGGDGPESARGPITTQGLVVGTPEYMSPEQGMGNSLDARSDLYSVGVILFQLLVGRLPFEAETALGLVFKQVNEPPPLPSSIRAGVDPRLESICMRALAKRPDDRFQSARELRSALRAFFGSDATHNSSSPSSAPRILDRRFEHAETVSLPISYPPVEPPRASPSRTDPTGTRSGTADLPALPVRQPSSWLIGAFAAVAGAGLLFFGVSRLTRPTEASVAGAAGLVDPSAQGSARPIDPTPSVDSILPGGLSGRDSVPANDRLVGEAVSAVAPRLGAAVPAHLPHTAVVAGAASSSVSPSPPSVSVAPFSLTTSSASPTVTRATGVAARDVRLALPSWKFTQCYQSALQRTNKALKGHVTLDLTMDGSGSVSKVAAKGAGQLFTSTSDCMVDALAHTSVPNAPASGSSAEVDVDCSPQ